MYIKPASGRNVTTSFNEWYLIMLSAECGDTPSCIFVTCLDISLRATNHYLANVRRMYVPWCMPWSLASGFLCQWRGKRSRHSRRMRNPHFYSSGKRPIAEVVDLSFVHLNICKPVAFSHTSQCWFATDSLRLRARWGNMMLPHQVPYRVCTSDDICFAIHSHLHVPVRLVVSAILILCQNNSILTKRHFLKLVSILVWWDTVHVVCENSELECPLPAGWFRYGRRFT